MARSKIDVENIGWSEQIKENVSISGSFTVEGQTSIPSSKKVNEKAISLDGVDDRIVVGDYDEFTFSNASGDLPFSVSAWIYVNDISTDIGTIVGKFTFSSAGNEWMFKQELGYLHFYMYDFDQSGTGDQKRIIASSATVTSNTWHHVVVTCDGGSASPGYTLYTDAATTAGTQQFTNNYAQTRNTSAPLTIGAADLGSGNRIFEDKIADVVIFNKELSSAEVTELYNSGNVKDIRTHSAYDNVISWWKMGDDLDSTSTDGIIDYVSGYHGTVENGASIVSETTLGSDNVGPISITRSGSLGVGIESPESTLHVAGRATIDGDLIVSANTTTEGYATFSRGAVVTGSTTVQNLIVDTAVVGDLVVSGSQIKVTSTGPTSLFLEADTDNATETDTAYIKLSQDGGAVPGFVGFTPASGKDPENNAYTDTLLNSLLISNDYTSGLVQLGTNSAVGLTVDASQNVGIGTNAPSAELEVNGDVKVSGQITAATQPAFLARKPSNNQDSFAINTGVDVTLGTEDFDVGSNFASNTFTAPTTGVYIFTANVYLTNLDVDADSYSLDLVTDAGTYRIAIIDPGGFSADVGEYTLNGSMPLLLTAGDTAKIQVYQAGGSQQTNIRGSGTRGTFFAGYLLG